MAAIWRLDAEPSRTDGEASQAPSHPASPPKGLTTDGATDWWKYVNSVPAAEQPKLRKLGEWAESLQQNGWVNLTTYSGTSGIVLLPRLLAENVGLVSVSSQGGGSLWLWRSVFERRAPKSIPEIVELIAPAQLKQGSVVRDLSDELLVALTAAYLKAAGGSRQGPPSSKQGGGTKP